MVGALTDRFSRWLVPGMIVAVTLAVAPGGDMPFSPVKTGVLGAASVALLLRALLAPSEPVSLAPRVLAGLWLGTLALSDLLGSAARPGGMWLGAAGGLVILSLLQAPPAQAPAVRAIAVGGTLLAVVAALQAVGLDPFRWMGWASTHPGERMRVYGTLGNPDFVAAYLGASLCVTLGEIVSARTSLFRWGWGAAVALQLGALAATRSWGSVLSLGAAALSLLWSGAARSSTSPQGSAKRHGWFVLMGAALVGALLLSAVWGRSLGSVLEGRLYLWRVAAPRVLDAPVFGHGPGSFVVLWPTWEAEYWARGAPEAQQAFVAVQDHAHLDYLEWLLELGVVGTAPRLLLLLAALRAGRHFGGARARAMVAALVALAVRALVDFPLARPAELCLFCVLTALVLGASREPEAPFTVRAPGVARTG